MQCNNLIIFRMRVKTYVIYLRGPTCFEQGLFQQWEPRHLKEGRQAYGVWSTVKGLRNSKRAYLSLFFDNVLFLV